MRQTFRLAFFAASFAAVSLVAAPNAVAPALAQDGGSPTAPRQVALSQKQIDGLIASQSEMSALQASTQGGNSDQADPKLQAKVEAIAKKHGFSGLEQYEAVTESIGIVMAGIDPQTKSYVGPAAVIKKQIAQVQADKSMPAKDKAAALKELKQAMAGGDTPKPTAANIELVSQNFDKLSQAFQGAGGEQ